MCTAGRPGTEAFMKRIANRFCAVVGIVISCLIFFAKWLSFQGVSYTILEFYAEVRRYGGISAFSNALEDPAVVAATGVSIVPAYLFLFLPLLLTAILLLRSVLFLAGKNANVLSSISYWTGFVYLLTVFLGVYTVRPAVAVSMILMVADYIGARLIMEHDEMNRKARELKRKEEAARLDKLRRMRFPGRYSKDFFEVIFANFRSNLKSYLLFILAASASVALIYVMFGALAAYHTLSPGQDVPSASGAQITSIFIEAAVIVVVLSVLLFVLIISNYIKTRMKNYGIFISLGIRRKTLGLVIALEYIVCILASLAAGLLAGNLFLPLTKILFLRAIGVHTSVPTDYGLLILITAIAFLLMAGLATLINDHLFEYTDITSSAVSETKKEKLPKRLLLVGLIYGIYCIITGISGYLYGYWMEGLSRLAVMLFGFLLLIYCGGSRLYRWFIKNRDRRLNHIFLTLPWKYRFRTNAKYLFLLFMIHIFALSVYLPRLSSVLTASAEKNLYPYDFVCMAHEGDEEFFQDLSADYDVQMETYPMVRIDTLLAEPFSFNTLKGSTNNGMFFPLGQHIGISESTYRTLKKIIRPDEKSSLNLNGREIHVVFQQDTSQRARLLDWYYSPMEDLGYDPHLRAGVICNYTLNNRDELYPPYRIKSQEKTVLTGMFHEGDQENIVVFSDSYFEELRQSVLDRIEEEPSPTQLITLKTADGEYQNVSEHLKVFTETHAADTYVDPTILPCYGKQASQSFAEGGRFFKAIAVSVTALILLISSLFVFYLKYSLEIGELRRRNQLLEAVGMNRRERVHLLRSDMSVHSRFAFLAGVAVSAIFFIGMPVKRLFTGAETARYLVLLAVLLAVYIVVYCTGIHFLEKGFIKKVEEP